MLTLGFVLTVSAAPWGMWPTGLRDEEKGRREEKGRERTKNLECRQCQEHNYRSCNSWTLHERRPSLCRDKTYNSANTAKHLRNGCCQMNASTCADKHNPEDKLAIFQRQTFRTLCSNTITRQIEVCADKDTWNKHLRPHESTVQKPCSPNIPAFWDQSFKTHIVQLEANRSL